MILSVLILGVRGKISEIGRAFNLLRFICAEWGGKRPKGYAVKF